MSNFDLYINNLKNIINGETINENPLYYYTKKFNDFTFDKLFNLGDSKLSKNSIDTDGCGFIYTFYKNNIIKINPKCGNYSIIFDNVSDYKLYALLVVNFHLWYVVYNEGLKLCCINLNNKEQEHTKIDLNSNEHILDI